MRISSTATLASALKRAIVSSRDALRRGLHRPAEIGHELGRRGGQVAALSAPAGRGWAWHGLVMSGVCGSSVGGRLDRPRPAASVGSRFVRLLGVAPVRASRGAGSPVVCPSGPWVAILIVMAGLSGGSGPTSAGWSASWQRGSVWCSWLVVPAVSRRWYRPVAAVRRSVAGYHGAGWMPPQRLRRPPGPTDTLGRAMRDLRISVTDRCNFRCTYCMPKEVFGRDYAFLPRDQVLTFEEIDRLARDLRRARRREAADHRRRAARPARPARPHRDARRDPATGWRRRST